MLGAGVGPGIRHLVVFDALEKAVEFFGAVGVGRIGGFGSLGLVAPVFVHPEPVLGFFADGILKDVPALLCNLLGGLGARKMQRRKSAHYVGAVGLRYRQAGNDRGPRFLYELRVDSGNAGLAPKTFDNGGDSPRGNREVSKQGGVPPAFEALEKAEHGTPLGNHCVSGVLAVFLEKRSEERVLELLGDEAEVVAEIPCAEADPLKITVVRGDPDGAFSPDGFQEFGVIVFKVAVIEKIVGGEPDAPELIADRSRKILKGAQGDFAHFGFGFFSSENHLQVLKGRLATAAIEAECQGTECSRESENAAPREQGNTPGESEDRQPFDAIAQSLPRGHGIIIAPKGSSGTRSIVL